MICAYSCYVSLKKNTTKLQDFLESIPHQCKILGEESKKGVHQHEEENVYLKT